MTIERHVPDYILEQLQQAIISKQKVALELLRSNGDPLIGEVMQDKTNFLTHVQFCNQGNLITIPINEIVRVIPQGKKQPHP